jgi:capsular polysaccharide transport system permease protein
MMTEVVPRSLAVARRAVVAVAGARWGAIGVRRLLGAFNIWFWAIVGVPTLLAGVYYFGIASDLYVSDVEFVVHGPAKESTPSLSGLMASMGGATGGSDDAYAVNDYMMSRDVVRKLVSHDDLIGVLSRPEGDFVSRASGLLSFGRKDFEALYKTYQRFVTVDLDTTTGVSTLEVSAYRPQDAQNIARALVQFSEAKVNDLNERQRQDAVGSFEAQVKSIEQRIGGLEDQMTAYRVKEKMLDPLSASRGPLDLVAQMNMQLAEIKAQLADKLRSAPHSPQIPVLRTRIGSLQRLIAEEHSKITGDRGSVATAAGEYDRLQVQLELSEKALASAFLSLQQSRLQAQRQQLYLELITEPNLADYPLYPRRVADFSTVVVTCLLAYGMAWLLVAGVREHASA